MDSCPYCGNNGISFSREITRSNNGVYEWGFYYCSSCGKKVGNLDLYDIILKMQDEILELSNEISHLKEEIGTIRLDNWDYPFR